MYLTIRYAAISTTPLLSVWKAIDKPRRGSLNPRNWVERDMRNSVDSAEHIPPSELDDIAQAALQQQIAVLALSYFPETSITGRSRPDSRAPIGHVSGEQGLHKT
jgi:hypothetical protein